MCIMEETPCHRIPQPAHTFTLYALAQRLVRMGLLVGETMSFSLHARRVAEAVQRTTVQIEHSGEVGEKGQGPS